MNSHKIIEAHYRQIADQLGILPPPLVIKKIEGRGECWYQNHIVINPDFKDIETLDRTIIHELTHHVLWHSGLQNHFHGPEFIATFMRGIMQAGGAGLEAQQWGLEHACRNAASRWFGYFSTERAYRLINKILQINPDINFSDFADVVASQKKTIWYHITAPVQHMLYAKFGSLGGDHAAEAVANGHSYITYVCCLLIYLLYFVLH